MITAIIIVAASAILFVVVTILNAKTKIPEGIELPDKCAGCNLICNKRETTLTKEVIEEINKDIHCQERNNEHESE